MPVPIPASAECPLGSNMQRSLLAAVMVLALAGAAEAQWRTYENERYRNRLHVPPGAEQPVLSDSGGGVSYSVEHGHLRIHATNLTGRSFEDDARGRLDAAAADGWRVNYANIEPRTATFDISATVSSVTSTESRSATAPRPSSNTTITAGTCNCSAPSSSTW